MAWVDGKELYSRLENDFNVSRALPAARAALGLMAVLRSWIAEGNPGLVALSACVCHDVVAAVLGAGCIPIFCDIDPIEGAVPDDEWARARATGATVALVVHLYGNPVDVSKVRRYFPSDNCLVIDDAAQALGSMNDEGHVGGMGDVGLLSFGPTKHVETGGAAILFKDSKFAEKVARTLALMEILPEEERMTIYSIFRRNFETAREGLRRDGVTAASAFHGILDGYHRSLPLPFPIGAVHATVLALNAYPSEREQRIRKSAAWAIGLEGSGLIPVGMRVGTVPWRYTCRLPAITWNEQHRLGEQMRSQGINISHWYIPAHWMCGNGPTTLPGTEQLAQEVFQFWVDGHTSLATIERDSATVTTILKSLTNKVENQ